MDWKSGWFQHHNMIKFYKSIGNKNVVSFSTNTCFTLGNKLLPFIENVLYVQYKGLNIKGLEVELCLTHVNKLKLVFGTGVKIKKVLYS